MPEKTWWNEVYQNFQNSHLKETVKYLDKNSANT